MAQIQLIAIDLDGTLLNSYSKVTPESKKAIEKARKNGVQIAIATGRGVHSTLKKLEGCQVDALITCNGTVLLDPRGEIQKEFTFTQEEMTALVAWLRQENIFFEAYTRDGYVISDKGYSRWRNYMKMIGSLKSIKHLFAHIKELNQFRSAWSTFKHFPIETTPFVKIYIWDADLDKLERLRDKVPEGLDVHVTDSGHNIEIIPKACSKYRMIKLLADSWGIPGSGIASIGDSNNDREMLVDSALGIAMGNAPQEIKEISDWVTKSNDEEGVAHAINYIVERQQLT